MRGFEGRCGRLAVQELTQSLWTRQHMRLNRARGQDTDVGTGSCAGTGQQPREVAIGMRLLLGDCHGSADVEQQVDTRRDLFAIKAHVQDIGTRVRGPVDVTKIIPGRVLTIVLKLERAAGATAQTLAKLAADWRP